MLLSVGWRGVAGEVEVVASRHHGVPAPLRRPTMEVEGQHRLGTPHGRPLLVVAMGRCAATTGHRTVRTGDGYLSVAHMRWRFERGHTRRELELRVRDGV